MENKVFQQQIKERTGWSDAIVRFLHSREEAEVYIKAGLVERRIGGREFAGEDIDICCIKPNNKKLRNIYRSSH